MIDWATAGFAWLTLVIGFVAGCAWNGNAYDRGYRDATRWGQHLGEGEQE